MKKHVFNQLISWMLILVMALGAMATVSAEETSGTTLPVAAPRVSKDCDAKARVVTWDTIEFGSYPQAEVVDSAEYTRIPADLLREGDLIVDPELHARLKVAEWIDNETIINGVRYKRMRRTDATKYSTTYQYMYNWTGVSYSEYRYFKYKPIKWRVLSVEGNSALVLSEKVLNDQKYDSKSQWDGWRSPAIRLVSYEQAIVKRNERGQTPLAKC